MIINNIIAIIALEHVYEVKIQLPEEVQLIHQINTDDPTGIEAYWHNRFKAKRKNGAWFELSKDDISTFERRKLM